MFNSPPPCLNVKGILTDFIERAFSKSFFALLIHLNSRNFSCRGIARNFKMRGGKWGGGGLTGTQNGSSP